MNSDMRAAGTIYTVKFTNVAASKNATMSAISVGDTKLSLTSAAGGMQITGTIPYGMTVGSVAEITNSDDAYFLDFTISDYAKLTPQAGEGALTFVSKGDTDGDGEADPVTDDNAKVYFVRDTTDQTVDVYFWGSSKGTNIKTGVTVNPEDTSN